MYYALLLAAIFPAHGHASDPKLEPGPWRAYVMTPGGELPFGLVLQHTASVWSAEIENGIEHIAIPVVELHYQPKREHAVLHLEFPHYDSQIEAAVSSDGKALIGTWRKRRSHDEWQELPFHAAAGAARRFTDTVLHAPPAESNREQLAREFTAAVERGNGRFAVRFASSAEPAVGIFDIGSDGKASGTFLTTSGDYRFLSGQLDRAFAGDDGIVGCVDDGLDHHFLRLSCFDGAHAFLFEAEVLHDGTLSGGFWSGAKHYEPWTATKDAHAAMPDAFSLSQVEGDRNLGSLAFPQVFPLVADPKTGQEAATKFPVRRVDDPQFLSKLRLIQIFGSWCPNCHDACAELRTLEQRFGARGLTVLGLAFELTGDIERDALQVQRYAARHRLSWPILLAGTADKTGATKALGILDRVHAYPTTLFVDAKGRVRYVYTGFYGPATKDAHEQQHLLFVRVIEELLGED